MQTVSESAFGNPRVLIADSDQKFCRKCAKILKSAECTVSYTLNGYKALKLLETETYDLVIIDSKMGRLGGREILRRVKAGYPDTVVIVTTGDPTVSSAVEVMKMGAFDYLPKPFTPRTLVAAVDQAMAQRGNRWPNQIRKDRRSGDRESLLSHLVGTSPEISKVIKRIEKAAQSDSTVLIEGESGTGKELVARAVHVGSGRKGSPFFLLDCNALTGELQAKELFGCVNVPLTGVSQVKQGIFELADGGTVMLDEISNIHPDIQEKLIRFIVSTEFMPVGGANVQKTDIRLVLTTTLNLQAMAKKGEFREDFYHQFCKDPIIIPPLRERKNGYHADRLPFSAAIHPEHW